MSSKRKKMRMTLPKKQEDIRNIMEEVSIEHGEHHHHHHHTGGIDEVMRVVDVLLSAMDTRIAEVEEKIDILRKEVVKLYQLLSVLVKSMSINDEEERVSVLKKAIEIIEQ